MNVGEGGEAQSPNDEKEKWASSPKRFAVLATGHASPFAQEKYGDYGSMFIDLLKDPGEEWEVFTVVDGQFPPDEDLAKFDGWVVTGSRHDAHTSEEWILRLCRLLQKLHKQKTPTLGICFGHQVLSRALGGKTGRADVGWDLGCKELQLTPALTAKPYAAELPPVIRILGIHQDQVSEVPPGGELLALSERTSVEMFCVGDHALGIQGHPEFTKDTVEELITSRRQLSIIPNEAAERGLRSMEAMDADKEALQKLCKAFLKQPRPFPQ